MNPVKETNCHHTKYIQILFLKSRFEQRIVPQVLKNLQKGLSFQDVPLGRVLQVQLLQIQTKVTIMGSGLAMQQRICYISNMTRPLRIEFKGAVYHITSRGNARQAIFLDEKDFADFIGVLCLKVILQGLTLMFSRLRNSSDPIGFPLKVTGLLSWFTCPY